MSEYKYCWSRTHRVAIEVCQHRLRTGKCKVLKKPKELDSGLRGFLGLEKGEIQIICEEVK